MLRSTSSAIAALHHLLQGGDDAAFMIFKLILMMIPPQLSCLISPKSQMLPGCCLLPATMGRRRTLFLQDDSGLTHTLFVILLCSFVMTQVGDPHKAFTHIMPNLVINSLFYLPHRVNILGCHFIKIYQ